jgi:AcrR family transcriptional regulator
MLPNMVPPRGAGRRLTADDWIEAGFAVLADRGPTALRVDTLCDRLNVTKGSFYWHFTDMPTYRDELASAWGSLHDRNRREFENMPDLDPRTRLTVMIQTWVDPQHWALERAMRAWALTDDGVLASVQQSDGRVLHAIRQAFADFGFGPEEAALRSFVVFATGVGLLHIRDSSPAAPPGMQDRFLDFILRP